MNKVKKATLLVLFLAGLGSTLLSSCANQKTVYTGPQMNPAYFNPDAREFETRWPFGPGGFR
jgi:hypothetical protein